MNKLENDALKDFFMKSIKQAEVSDAEKGMSEEFLRTFLDSLSSALSSYANTEIEVTTSSNDVMRVFSRMSRNVKNFDLDKRHMPIQDTYEPVSISFGFKNGMPLGQIGEYKPEPTAYFPVRVCYGSKEFCCSNHKEVEASLKTMVNDSMHQILKRIDSKKNSTQKIGQ